MHELKYVGRWILPSVYLETVCNVSIALLKSGRVACMHPENPRFWRSVSDSVGMFDGELRLSCSRLAAVVYCITILTQRRLAQQAQSKSRVWHISREFHRGLPCDQRNQSRGGRER